MSKNLFAALLGLNATARSMGAPFQTAAALRADAEKEVDKIVARVEATSQAGGLRQLKPVLQGIPRATDRQGRTGAASRRYGVRGSKQLDQRTALPDQCLHSAEADVRPPRRKSGFGPTAGLAVQGVGCRRGNAPAGRTNATCKKAERGLSPIGPGLRRSDRPVT